MYYFQITQKKIIGSVYRMKEITSKADFEILVAKKL